MLFSTTCRAWLLRLSNACIEKGCRCFVQPEDGVQTANVYSERSWDCVHVTVLAPSATAAGQLHNMLRPLHTHVHNSRIANETFKSKLPQTCAYIGS